MGNVIRVMMLVLPVTSLILAGPLCAQPTPEPTAILPAQEEARRTVELMGGADRVRAAAGDAVRQGGAEDLAWALKLTGYLVLLDPQDPAALSLQSAAQEALAADSLPGASQRPDESPPDVVGGSPMAMDYLFPAADPWNIDRNVISGSIADAQWSIDEVFPGTKLILEGRWSFGRETMEPPGPDCACEPLPPATRLAGTVGAHVQWGEGETGLEYYRLSFTPLSYQRVFQPDPAGFSPLRDTVEWGAIQAAKDDPLGIDDYYELSLVRGSRTWLWQPRRTGLDFTLGVQGWVGYAWADSIDPTYEDVSNPIIGSSFKGTINRPRWGQLYVEQRVVNGFTFSSPSAGGSVSREARFRAGTILGLPGCLSLDVYVEKRSFNFTDHRLDDLYTKSRRIGVALGCGFQ